MSDLPNGDETPKNDPVTPDFEDEFVSKDEYAKAAKKASDQEGRAKKAEEELKALKQQLEEAQKGPEVTPKAEDTPETPTSTPNSPSMEMLEGVVMTQAGYGSEAEQAVIRSAAKELGIPVQEAMAKKYVVAEVNELRAQEKAKEATDFTPSGGGDDPTQDDLVVREFERTGSIPTTGNPVTDRDTTLKLYEALKKKEGLN